MRRLVVCSFLLVLATAAAAAAPAPAPAGSPLPAGVTRVASVEGITEYRLANGLRVLLFPDLSKETITVNVTYLVGSRHEGYGESGMAHLLEHLVFKGTPKHPDIPQELTAHGCRPNGSTWFDRTNYFETFAASEQNLDWALDLEADRMVNSFISKQHLESEFSVVRNEFEVGENYPQGVLMERMLSSAYLWHNYGKSTIGSRADIERVPIDNLKAFYKKWYRPDNAVLVVAGKIDEAVALRKVAAAFGPIPRPAEPLAPTYSVEPAQDGERTVTLRRVGDIQMAAAAYHVPAGSDPEFAAVDLLAFILGDEPSGRLYKTLVETKKASSVFGFAWPLFEPGVMLVGTELRKENSVEEARSVMLRTIAELGAAPPTAEEVERARENRLRGWETTMRNSEWAAIELSEWSALGDWRLMFVYRDRLKAVTAADVARVASNYLRDENRTVGVYIPSSVPTRTEVPERQDVTALVEAYRGGEALAQGEEFDAAPAAIEARIVRADLAPGLELAMVPKKSRGSTVQVALSFNLGNEKSLQGRATAGEMTGSMLMRGTKNRTRQQIEDEIDRLKAQISVDGSATRAFANVETTRANLEAALRLVAELLRAPSFPAAELELLRQERLTQIEDSRNDPFQVATTALRKHLDPWPKGDPRYAATPDEEIESSKAVTLDDVKRFHADFYGASAAQAGIVGDFDPAQVEALLRELFGEWKSATPFARLANPYRERPPIQETLETPDKESAVFMAGLPLKLGDGAAEYPALVLGNFMTGGGFLNSRLATRIRQNEGISYGVGSFFSASPFEENGYFGSYAIYAPQNGELLVRAFREELGRVVDAGFAPQEIAEAKQGWLQQRRVSRASDRELARTLAAREYEGRTLAWDERLESRVEALTNEQIVAAVARFLDIAKISIVQAGDFAKVREAAAVAAPDAEPAAVR